MNQNISSIRNKKIAMIVSSLSFILLLTGTFTWVSLSQMARADLTHVTEESKAISGGRIHDDFNGENKDIYAENFGDTNLLVRIKLVEYMEIDDVPVVTGTNREDKTTWVPNILGVDNEFSAYVEWIRGGEKIFMPTINTDPDSLLTDASGIAIDDLTGGQTAPGDGSHDYWTIGDIHPEYDPESGEVPRPAKPTLSPEMGGYMSMEEWIEAGNPKGNFWVIDTDGWAYWANILAPEEATSLLVDAIQINSLPSEDWYYASHVIGEFATEYNATEFTDMSANAQDLIFNLVQKVRYTIVLSNIPETVVPGSSQQLFAIVSKDGIALDDASVTWSIVSPHAEGTNITNNGLITIADDEDSELIVRATYDTIFIDAVLTVTSSYVPSE